MAACASFFARAALLVASGAFVVAAGDDYCARKPEYCALALLQLKAGEIYTAKHKPETCSELANHGSYFSVQVHVGTPAQKFDVVADTGSDAVIVPSCLCQSSGQCSAEDKCFTGTNKSSSFVIASKKVPMVSMEFGSGTIAAAVSTDVVKVGGTSALMDQGLLLMVDKQLDINGPFEGILGLGQLQSEYQADSVEADEDERADWDIPKTDAVPSQKKSRMAMPVPGFLRESQTDRFSICFNDGVSPGVLRLNTPKMHNLLPSVGTMHWGLEFSGMSIGNSKAPVLFCGNGSSDCGAIPDSGTTVMLGPEAHVRQLFSAICDEWPRCSKAAKKGPFKGKAKEEVFQRVLLECETWLSEKDGQGLDELPRINLHLGGASGNQTVALSGWSYVFEAAIAEMEQHSKLLGNVGLSALKENRTFEPLSANASSAQYACTPAFGASDMQSGGSGDVWIIGTPLFYEYVVSYDLGASPPSMAFGIEPCGSCGAQDTMLIAGQNKNNIASRILGQDRKAPRRIRGGPRVGRRTSKLRL